MKKNWTNTYKFEFGTVISENSNITPFMVNHKMFPGSVLKCSVDMKPCNHGYNNHASLRIHVEVWKSTYKQDEFYVTQGMFCKIMSNVHSDKMSTYIN